jgi:uncharacterized SAM-binding protein YcdF (DUF218 family)
MVFAVLAVAVISAWALAHAGTALVVSHPLASPDAIVMLASHEWERLPAAAALARQHPNALVLLTVPRVITKYNCHLCQDRPAWLEAEGVDRSRIRLLPRRAMNTYEEAQAALAYTRAVGLTRVAIVTSPYHTRRAWGTFRAVFNGTATALGITPAAGAPGRPERWWLSAYDRSYVRYEWAAVIKYRVAYGVVALTSLA